MPFSVVAFNQLKSSNSRQGGSLDGIVSFFEPFLNNQVKWSLLELIILTSHCVGSGHCHWAPTVDSVLWPGHKNHPHIPHLWRWWHGEMHSRKGLLSGRWSYQNSLQISEILETQTIAGVWTFLTDPDFGMLMIFRITIVALSFAVGFPLLALKGPIGSDLIEAISPWLQWHLFIFSIFLFYLYFV